MLSKVEKYKKYFAFEGKASRSEYWGAYLVSCVLLSVSLLTALTFFVLSAPLTIILIGFMGWAISLSILCAGFILSTWLCAATSIRRCNDAGINPWFALTLLLPPPFGTIPFIVFGLLKTDTEHGSAN